MTGRNREQYYNGWNSSFVATSGPYLCSTRQETRLYKYKLVLFVQIPVVCL